MNSLATYLLFWRKYPEAASPEAQAALSHARQTQERAEVVYADRRRMLDNNHFAERIRMIYEGQR